MISLTSATFYQPDWARCVASWQHPILIIPGMDILPAYQLAYKMTHGEIIGHTHDDTICNDPNWVERVEAEFADPQVALVGFGGATGHGELDMYTRGKFEIPSMVRIDFRSNLIDAERHGLRLTGSMNAAVLDGFAFFVRRTFLHLIGGWPLGTPISYFMYMEWLSCMARRHRRKIRVVGVACEHLGGKTSGRNPNLHLDYEGEHRWLYENFRDVFPARIEP